ARQTPMPTMFTPTQQQISRKYARAVLKLTVFIPAFPIHLFALPVQSLMQNILTSPTRPSLRKMVIPVLRNIRMCAEKPYQAPQNIRLTSGLITACPYSMEKNSTQTSMRNTTANLILIIHCQLMAGWMEERLWISV